MAKEIDKIIQSKTTPKSKNVLWDNGENLKINRKGKWESIGGGVPMLNVKYAELVDLRNNNKLIAGMQYRITDYVTTTAQENTRSAGHQFDVIVTADNKNTLNEVARACLHEGDTYFSEAGAKLEAWQIWYSLDNDTERFAWADAQNGKGVIYRMIDEWNNDVPYDFKNIVYIFNKSFMYNQRGKDSEFIRDSSIDKVINGTQYYGYVTDNLPNAWSEGKCWVADADVTANSQLYKENGSVISYGGTIYNISNEEYESFTFNEGELNDFSLEGEFCYENTILTWTGGLNKIVFKNNKTQSNCTCHSNSFGANCYGNRFGTDCYSNRFGADCYYNSFGNHCNYNSFGDVCYSNSFGNNFFSNSLGNYLESNTFGNNCSANSLGNNCHAISFGNYCLFNSLGDNCYEIRFANPNNDMGSGHYFKDNSFEHNVFYFSLVDDNEYSATFDNPIQYYHVCSGVSETSIVATQGNYTKHTIARNSEGEIKTYCEADLIA